MKIHDGEYQIEFDHSVQMPLARAVTECIMWDAITQRVVAKGKVVFGSDEPWSRVLGRKRALADALKKFPKSFRSYIWGGYWGVSQRPQSEVSKLRSQLAKLKQSSAEIANERRCLALCLINLISEMVAIRTGVLRMAQENAELKSEKALAIAG